MAPVQQAGLRITAASTTVSAGVPFSVTVGRYDGVGALTADYTGLIPFDSNDTRASLPAPYTFVTADGGAKTFEATFGTSGTQSLRVQDASEAGSAFGAPLCSVVPGSYSRPGLSLSTNVIVAGAPAMLTVSAQDGQGNCVTDINAEISFYMVLDGNTSVTVPATFASGQATVSLNQDPNDLLMTLAATTHNLKLTDLGRAISAELDDVIVLPSEAKQMRWSVASNSNTYQQMSAALRVYDAYDNLKTDYAGSVLISSTYPQVAFSAAPNDNAPLGYAPNAIESMQAPIRSMPTIRAVTPSGSPSKLSLSTLLMTPRPSCKACKPSPRNKAVCQA